MALPPGFLDDLRSRVSIARVVGRKVAWDARKSNPARGDFWAPCPFHVEKTASFHVDDAKGYYYCFGCQAKGDAVSFVRETENLGFIEAVEVLAREAGIEMPAADPAAAARSAASAGLVEAMEAAVRFYRLQLNSARAAGARAYLDRRGLTPATRARFEIGFAPDSRAALLDHLAARGFSRNLLAEAGLIGLPEGGGAPYDRFRGRIMFPIRDARGQAVAFGARALADQQQPKYLNSPDTPLFDKGRTLYNIGPARAAAGRAGALIVVEGYMDAIALVQSGIAHVTAPLGTAITEAQLRLLWRVAPEPVVALDGDAAGAGAAQRLIDLALPLLAPGRSLRFAAMPPGKDPDDVIREGGPGAFQRLLDASRPIVDLIWARETAAIVLDSPERRAALDARLRAHLGRIADSNLRAHYQSEIRARRAALFAPVPRSRGPGPMRDKAGWRGGPRSRSIEGAASPAALASLLGRGEGLLAEARIRESAILAGCLNHPALLPGFEDRLARMRFVCGDLAEIRDALLSALDQSLHASLRAEPPLAGQTLAWSQAVRDRLGRDPIPELIAIGQVRANRHLLAGEDADRAAAAIGEELTRHAAFAGRLDEVRDAELELAGSPDEGLTWRLRHAAEAVHSALTQPLAQGTDEAKGDRQADLDYLQHLLDAPADKTRPR